MLRNVIIDPWFPEENLNRNRNLFLDTLEETNDPLLTHEIETQNVAQRLQEDLSDFQYSAPPNYFRLVWQFEQFRDRAICTLVVIELPLKSPDSTSLIFWDILNPLYITHNLVILLNLDEDLQQHAGQFMAKISEMVERC